MKNEIEFCTTKNVIIAIERIVIIQIDSDNIEYINFYINDEKMRSYYRIVSLFDIDERILCTVEEILKIVVKTKNDKKVKITIFGSDVFIHKDKVE